jgi:hypothetical protein
MPSNYGTVSRRFLEQLDLVERGGPTLKAAAAVSDAALVEQTGQQQGAAPGQPVMLPDELYQMAQDPNLSPAERATVLQAAERINLLMSPVEPEAPQAQPGQPGQQEQPQPQVQNQPAQEGAPVPAGEKSAEETDPDYDFSDIVPEKQAHAIFQNAATSEGVLGWLRARSGH